MQQCEIINLLNQRKVDAATIYIWKYGLNTI